MDVTVLETIFKFGKLLSLTPSSLKIQNSNNFQKFHTFVICSAYNAIFFGTIIVGWPLYTRMTTMQFILGLFLAVALYVNDHFIFFSAKIYKRDEWSKLITSLEFITDERNSFKMYFWSFTSTQIFMVLIVNFGSIVTWKNFGFTGFVLNLLEFLQIYIEVFGVVLRFIILDILRSRYRQQVVMFQKLSDKVFFKKLKFNILILDDAVRCFNSLFGWPILTSIFGCSLKTLIWLDIWIKSDGSFATSDSFLKILNSLYHTTLALIRWVRILWMTYLIYVFLILGLCFEVHLFLR